MKIEEFVPYLEEDDEELEDEGDIFNQARHEIVEFVLRRFGVLSTRDIARILNWKTKDVNVVLKELESSGRIKRMKLGKTQAWSHIEEHVRNPMFY